MPNLSRLCTHLFQSDGIGLRSPANGHRSTVIDQPPSNSLPLAQNRPFFYISTMNRFKDFVEWNAFGVCSAIGNRMGIATSRIRQYFIYTSLLTMGSPIIIYMILAFWRNLRKYTTAAKRNPWYYL